MSIADEQRRYYGELLRRFGDDPRALGHRDRETQHERFVRLARVFDAEDGPFTVHEIGCGLGDLGGYLADRHPLARYSGSDVCEEFVDACRSRFPEGRFELRDVTAELPDDRYDYVVQSGTLNGRLGTSNAEWTEFVFDLTRAMYRMAGRGVATNFLSSYGDADRKREDLHYQDPIAIVDFVRGELSRHWEIDAAGPLYEFTLRIYRPGYVASRYPDAAFTRYFRPGRE